MSYQRAQRLKGAGLGRLMVNRIVAGQGVGKSIKSAISDKVVAKMTRIKEKFDPMNIAKAFGGRLGAYAMGKMTGRSEEDMSYFTGAGRRGKNSTYAANTKKNPMITKIAEGNTQKMKKGDGLADVLSKIYNLIKQDSADRIQHDEVQKNLLVDKEKQRQKWHEELIKALGGKSSTTKTVSTAEKPKEDGFMSMIEGMLDSILGKGMLDKIKGFFSGGLFKTISEFFDGKIFSILSSVARFFLFNPIGLALLAGSSLLALLALDKDPESTTKGILNSVNDNAIGSEIAKQQQENVSSDEINKKIEVRQALLKDAGLMTKYFSTEDQKAYIEKLGVSKAETADLYNDTKKLKVPEKLKEVDPDLYKKLKGGGASPTGVTATPVPASSTPSAETTPAPTTPSASPTPAAASPVTQQMQENVNTNNNMKLDESTSPKIITIDNSKTNNMGGGGSGSSISNDSSVPVRTDDDTLQNIFKKNLRMV